MRTFNPSSFAKQLVKASDANDMTVMVIDNDLCLVIRVYEGTPENYDRLIGQHDTGLSDSCPEVDEQASQLVASLVKAGVNAKRHV